MRSAAILAVWLIPVVALAGPLAVFDGGRAAAIVKADGLQAEGLEAVRDLAAYLKRSTGAEFTVISEAEADPARHPVRLYVGAVAALPAADREALVTLDSDAYLVDITADGSAFLVGPQPWSTYWAVCQFLEDQVGVRWLFPGPLGEDVPEHERLVLPPWRQVYTPVLLSRQWSGDHHGGRWSLRQRLHARYRFHHNLVRVFDAERYYDEHPEWFPLRASGQRYRPQGEKDHSWQPCLASDSSVRHAAACARQAWAENPGLDSFSYGCNDGQGWCECEGCKAMDRPLTPWEGFEGTYSCRYYAWLNRVAADLETTHPENLIGCLAYSTYILPPEPIGLHRNVIPYYTSNRADYYEPEFRQQDQRLLEWWGRVAHQMGIYDYAYGMGFAIPRIYSHLFQEAIQHAVKNRVKGFYAEVYPNWGLDGPKLYLMSRVLWNPAVDIDALFTEWNQRLFRESWEPMAAYFRRCERAWSEQRTGRGHWAYRLAGDPRQFEVFPPAVLAECTGYLDQAAALAQSDLVRERIRFFRKTWEITLLLAGNYWAGHEVDRLVAAEAPLEQVAAALRRMADQVATLDTDAYVRERVGNDPIAFHPPLPGWFEPLKAGADANAMRLSASRLSARVVREAVDGGRISADDLRDLIGRRLDEAFGTAGSENYRAYVARLRAMALKVAKVARCDAPPAIDGRLDDPAWTGADVLTDFVRWGNTAAAQYPTRARLLHDGTMLYIALDCEQDTSALQTDAAPRDGSTWKDDSVEIFINPGLEALPYVQFILNARGAFFDLWGRREGESYAERVGATFSCRWATQVEPGRWTGELAIPLSEFGCTAAPRTLLRLNLARNVQGKAPEISAWFLSVKAHADAASRGWIVFE